MDRRDLIKNAVAALVVVPTISMGDTDPIAQQENKKPVQEEIDDNIEVSITTRVGNECRFITYVRNNEEDITRCRDSSEEKEKLLRSMISIAIKDYNQVYPVW
jgi:hypothetical protein